MKYTKLNATEFEESSLLPVQFAPLIEPLQIDITNNIIEIGEFSISFHFSCNLTSRHQYNKVRWYANAGNATH